MFNEQVKRIILAAAIVLICSAGFAGASAKYVIQISIDGLGSCYLAKMLDNNEVPNFKRLKVEGASTLNARTDYDITVTLPNHTTMITARGVKGRFGA